MSAAKIHYLSDVKKTLAFLAFGLILISCQPTFFAQSTAAAIEASAKLRARLRQESIFANYPARNIGPTQQGGRIVDLDADPRNPKWIYAAFASGGLWRSTNNGMSFEPIFDEQGTMGIGDIAVSQSNPDIIWVGTGECNSSRSSYAGMGVFASHDAGKTWKHLGLTATSHISRIICHPSDPNTVWVAAIGALYTENIERGVFKTTDGGKTWEKTLFINAQTGVIDLAIDPSNPEHLIAATWERSRKAWDFDEDGSGSGIYNSTDGGNTWQKSMTGLPNTDQNGRFGLSFSPSNPNIVYALLDNQASDPSLQKEDTMGGITARELAKMSAEKFLSLSDSNMNAFLRGRGYPEKYDAKTVKSDLKSGKYSIADLSNYFGDANDALFNSAVKGAELYQSQDGGKTWKRTHDKPLNDVYYTYGYYFGMLKVAPDNPNEVYIAGVPMLQSKDAGKNWKRVWEEDIHVDHHCLWIDPKDPEHIILGNDGGLYLSYDKGEHVQHLANISAGQFYTVAVDLETPYNVYGGLQDNGVQKGSNGNSPTEKGDWEYLFGGDGMYVVPDLKSKEIVYTGFQFGNYFRLEKGKSPAYLTPKHDVGTEKYRWNWRTPFVGSPHNHEILYMGSQYLFRSLDMGANWEQISPDLTGNKQPQGNVPYSTLSAVAESPLKFGLIWAGSDDGLVHVSTDCGNTWKNVSESLPKGLWVSSIFPSPHHKESAYLCLTGYRNDEIALHIYKTTDLGAHWESLKGNLPDEAANVLIEDHQAEGLLFLGTDQGTYASFDNGKNWAALTQIPNVASYDMLVHPREADLVVGTHGRSIWIVSIDLMRKYMLMKPDESMVYASPNKIRWRKDWGIVENPFTPAEEPNLKLQFMLSPNAGTGNLQFVVKNSEGKKLHTLDFPERKPGFNTLEWNLKIKEKGKFYYLGIGEYTLATELNGKTIEIPFKVTK